MLWPACNNLQLPETRVGHYTQRYWARALSAFGGATIKPFTRVSIPVKSIGGTKYNETF